MHLPILPRIQIKSTSIEIVKGQSVFPSNLNMTHGNGTGHIWTEQPIHISAGTSIFISPFQWNDIVFGDGTLQIEDLNLGSSIGNVYGDFGIGEDVLWVILNRLLN